MDGKKEIVLVLTLDEAEFLEAYLKDVLARREQERDLDLPGLNAVQKQLLRVITIAVEAYLRSIIQKIELAKASEGGTG